MSDSVLKGLPELAGMLRDLNGRGVILHSSEVKLLLDHLDESAALREEIKNLTLLSDSQLANQERLTEELVKVRLAYGLSLKLHGCDGDDCTEEAYLKDAESMMAERRKLKIEAANQERLVGEMSLSHAVREQLWYSHGCLGIYGDDGEMQCAFCQPFIDFKRDSEVKILEGCKIHAMTRMQRSLAPKDAPTEPKSAPEEK